MTKRDGRGRQMEKSERIDLGLALLSLVAIPGVPLTLDDMAAWCDCTRQALENVERITLKKVRNYLWQRNRPLWEELRTALYDRRAPAQSRWHHHPATRDPSLIS